MTLRERWLAHTGAIFRRGAIRVGFKPWRWHDGKEDWERFPVARIHLKTRKKATLSGFNRRAA